MKYIKKPRILCALVIFLAIFVLISCKQPEQRDTNEAPEESVPHPTLGPTVAPAPVTEDGEGAAPRLVVGIVVDQMAYDFLDRFRDKYGEDGFKRLAGDGFIFRNARFNYVPTTTCLGHASIYTGTTPSVHGIIGNDWFVRAPENDETYCARDLSASLVGGGPEADEKAGRLSPRPAPLPVRVPRGPGGLRSPGRRRGFGGVTSGGPRGGKGAVNELRTPLYTVNIGPQHPSTHGVFRMRATLDGEQIVDVEMVLGYLHRSMEKLAEERTFTQNIPFTDRMDYLAAMTGNLSYCLAVEKLAGVDVPERASYLRVIFAELQRIASHAMALGTFINDCGAWQTPLLYMFREREKILDLFEMTCGARLTTNYMRIGGVSFDVPDEWYPAIRALLAELPDRIGEYEDLLLDNEILLARARDVGVLPPDVAINAAASTRAKLHDIDER